MRLRRIGSARPSNFHVDKKEGTPRKTRLQADGDVPANGNNTTFSETRASSLTKRWNEADHGMLGTAHNEATLGLHTKKAAQGDAVAP